MVCVCCRTSLQYGIACLKRVNYDRIELDRRREESADDVKGSCIVLCILRTTAALTDFVIRLYMSLQNCSVLYCIRSFCPIMYTFKRAFLRSELRPVGVGLGLVYLFGDDACFANVAFLVDSVDTSEWIFTKL